MSTLGSASGIIFISSSFESLGRASKKFIIASSVSSERRITYSDNTNDFYKPIPSSMFPIVNGKSSLHCYFKSLIECQYEFLKKEKGSIFDFDSILFHTPFTKITQKALARMEALDNKFMKNPQNINKQEIIDLSREAEKKFINNSKLYNLKTLPSTRLAKNVGNCNTASLYMSLYSYLDSIKCKPLVETVNKKILLYSYGSGLIASLFTLRFNSSEKIIQKLFSTFTPIEQLLSNKTCISSQEYTTLSKLLEKNYNDKQNFTFLQFYQFPYQNFYLSNIDSNFCRNYEYKY
ncbi:hypothetical protein A3Q56_03097 [Intoshia linei]|uniref:Hydroxymethylglutaryl-coenzyme A synthase C-terminal domain-containing protein n=1 Tax=Intoshia linei TaxID=1819745 RepID=A0A177B6V2_9BILA|nr:hypothetical protein A3Q56_03097 [Intoshia linei]